MGDRIVLKGTLRFDPESGLLEALLRVAFRQ